MDLIYTYEGGYIELLCLIMYLLKNNIRPANIKNKTYSPSLFENLISLEIHITQNIIKFMENNFGSYATRLTYYVFLSEEENKEIIIYYFILNAQKYHQNIIYRRDLKCVSEVLRISQYVSHESHKLKGFLRFRELENKILYAEMEPTNDIIIIVSNHFKKRLNKEYWIIRDVKRGLLSIYDKKKFLIIPEDNFIMNAFILSDEEKDMENLWKVFYKTIGIKERKNDRCRMNFMPKKYWKYMTEMEEGI